MNGVKLALSTMQLAAIMPQFWLPPQPKERVAP
jgi:hypothetical protein